MKKYDIVAIGELNVDIILNHIEGFPQVGKEIFANKMVTVLGSSTAIFAANASMLGLRVAVVGMIANDFYGNLVRNTLRERGVDTSYIVEHPTIPTGATIVMTYGDDRANITHQGTMDIMTLDDINREIFSQAKHIHVSSIFMQSGVKRDLKKIVQLAHQSGATTSLDPQWDPKEKWDFDYKELLPYISVFLPNENEIRCITGKTKLEEAMEAVKPYINVCVVKQSTTGSILLHKMEQARFKPSFAHKKLVDAIGAGDSFNAGFMYQYLKGHAINDCQDFGNLMGAINTTAVGGIAAFGSKEKIVDIAKEVFTTDIGWLLNTES